MHSQKTTTPKICVLTQTASDVRPYYREFFAGLDLFFVTFKHKHPEAVDFLPGSTWSDGRNRLWEHVKGQYDYYLFIDDDLEFFGLVTSLASDSERFLQRMARWRPRPLAGRVLRRLGLRQPLPLPPPDADHLRYRKAEPDRFLQVLQAHLSTYRPAVASMALTSEGVAFYAQDQDVLRYGRLVRPMCWFDAQVTLFSNVGASLLLPYDTHISGWWSSQVPIYVLAHLAFKDGAINIMDLATTNATHTVYRAGYDGFKDCLEMSAWLSPGILDPHLDSLNLPDNSFIDHDFEVEYTRTEVKIAEPGEQTLEMALVTLSKSFDLHHPYIYERHQAIVDNLDGISSTVRRQEVHG